MASASVVPSESSRSAGLDSSPALAVLPASVAAPTALYTPSPEELAEFRAASDHLESATPREIIAWAVEHYHPKLGMATAFGPEGCVILHYLAEIEPKTYVFNLETGYQFKETLELRDRIHQRYGIEVEFRSAPTTVAEYEQLNNGPVYKTNPDKCCSIAS